jgi:hypothetical protein
MYNWFIIANGVDPLLKWDGTGVFRQVGTSPQYAKIVAKYKERLFGISYVNEPLQISWTVPGTLDDWSGIGSGSGLLSGGTDKILNAKLLGQVLMIYKEDESYMCSYIGGTQYFRFDQAVVGNGIVAAKSLVEFQSRHAYLGNDNIYLYEGGRVVAPIGDAVQHEMFSQLAPSQIGRSFSFVRGDENEAWFVVPSLDSDGPSVAWVYNYSLQRWFRHDISITAAGLWKAPTDVSYGKASGTYAEQALRFGDSIYKTSAPLVVLGTIDGKVLQLDQGSYNDSSTLPIVEIFDTPVISIPVESSTENVRRWLGVSADVRGASISCYYKVEEDGEWTLAGTASPGTYWQKVQFDIDVSSQYLWLRFSASGLSTWFDIRGYEVHYLRRRSEG